MQLKNYYEILGVEPSATLPEIRKAYRRLAMQHHPDKNTGNANAAAHFTEIKEAYEVLTDPTKKEYYLQQRWYLQSMGKKNTGGILTPVVLLKQVLDLERYLSRLDIHRMDREGLFQHMIELLSDSTIAKLNQFKEPDINKEITRALLRCLDYLGFERLQSIQQQLLKIENEPASIDSVNTYVIHREKKFRREKYTIWLVIIAVLAISLLIFLGS